MAPELTDWFTQPPYSLTRKEKQARLTAFLIQLTKKHYKACKPYRNILNAQKFDVNNISSYRDIPFLPVRLFKELDLLSIPENEVVKTMTSSGTTGQAVSKIFLDSHTSVNQMKTLTNIVSSFIGKKRLPMLILDTSAVLKNRAMFSARGAGILGFSLFASEKTYALDDDMNLNQELVKSFFEKAQRQEDFVIWLYIYDLATLLQRAAKVRL